ncbi:hypothetical protein M5689_010481 [Euphorbia peplus]|nr:hypothetical protein M5689_010481 [Euphorbia peplus]
MVKIYMDAAVDENGSTYRPDSIVTRNSSPKELASSGIPTESAELQQVKPLAKACSFNSNIVELDSDIVNADSSCQGQTKQGEGV